MNFSQLMTTGMDLEFVKLVNELTDAFPLSWESGYRSEVHNKAVGGKTNSAHRYGKAVDLIPDRMVNLSELLSTCFSMGFYGIEYDMRNQHLHVDNHPSMREYHVVILKDGTEVPLAKWLGEHPVPSAKIV